jgi:hypothetical protein
MRTNVTVIPCATLNFGGLWWLTFSLLAAALLIPTPSHGVTSLHSSARAAGMAGAYTGLAKGVDAVRYNPANLGLADYRKYGIEFVSVDASITNNSFTLSDYNKYTGATLSTADKQDILGKIPTEGLSVDADVTASAMTIALGSFVLSTQGTGNADVNINKDVVDLILNGNVYDDTTNLTGSYSDGLSYVSAGLSYGLPIYSSGTRQLAIGFTANYIRGIAVEELLEFDGHATTHALGIDGQGSVVVRTATGGSGYSLDLGAALKLNNSYTAGVRVHNALGSIKWSDETEERGYTFNYVGATLDDMGDDESGDSEDYTRSIGSFTTTLPCIMNVGVARTSGRLLLAVDWIQGLQETAGASTKPQLAMGAEWSVLRILPLRAGYSIGGERGSQFSFGSGLKLLGFYIDAAVYTGSTMTMYSSKGANFAVSTGIQF